ncbi:MAG: dockerin type I repeat-containing protein [bacterium]
MRTWIIRWGLGLGIFGAFAFAGSGVSAAGLAVVNLGSPVVYQTGFESTDTPAYSVGNLNGQDGWTVQSGTTAEVVTDPVFAGTQAVRLSAGAMIDRAISGTGQSVVWLEGYFRGTGSASTPDDPATPAASAIIHFSQTNGIQCLNGNGSGGGSFVDTGVAINSTTWYKISVKLNYTTQKWDCYVDGVKKQSVLGFRDNVSQLNGYRNFSETISYLDSLRVLKSNKGDANGDQVVNIGDVVIVVNLSNGGTLSDPILADNADMNNSASVTVEDVTAVANLVLGN